MHSYAYAWAQVPRGTGAAERRDGLAHVLAEGDEEVVVGDPVAAGQDLPEGEFRLLRSLRRHDAQPVADAVDMGVHADPGLAEADGEHEVRGLPADPFQGQETVHGIGNLAAVPLEESATNLSDGLGLGAVEPRRARAGGG